MHEVQNGGKGFGIEQPHRRSELYLGLDVEGKPIEKLSPLEYINMEGEDDSEVEYSIEELVQLVQDLIPWKKTH